MLFCLPPCLLSNSRAIIPIIPPTEATSSSSSATAAVTVSCPSLSRPPWGWQAAHCARQSNIFGGILGNVGNSAYEIERAVQGSGHDKAFRECIEEAKPNFRQCPKCSHWACVAVCWNQKRGLCFDCAPDIETELAAAQAQTTVDQMREKVKEQDLTKNLNLTSEAAALCPSCGARTQGAKFCPECGKPLRPKNECGRCGTTVESGAKFCPECGNKMA